MSTNYDITYAAGGYLPGTPNAAGVPSDLAAGNIASATVHVPSAQEIADANSIPTLAFMQRFTATERSVLHLARTNPNTPDAIRGPLLDADQLVTIAPTINVTASDTIGFAGLAVQVLVAAGLVASADADARKAALLAPNG